MGSVSTRDLHSPIRVDPVKKFAASPMPRLAMVLSAIMVPPVSLMLREKQRITPVARPARNSGRVMVLAAVRRLAPRVLPATS